MTITKNELMRIAEICKLDFSDEEYDILGQSLETTISEAEVLFQSSDCDDITDIDTDKLIQISKSSLSFCQPQKEITN